MKKKGGGGGGVFDVWWDMCRIEEDRSEKKRRNRWGLRGFGLGLGLGGAMGLKGGSIIHHSRVEKLRNSMVSRSKMKLWMIRATSSVILWICLVQLTALGESFGPRVLKGWPSCFSQESGSGSGSAATVAAVALDVKSAPEDVPARVLPPKSEFFHLPMIDYVSVL